MSEDDVGKGSKVEIKYYDKLDVEAEILRQFLYPDNSQSGNIEKQHTAKLKGIIYGKALQHCLPY